MDICERKRHHRSFWLLEGLVLVALSWPILAQESEESLVTPRSSSGVPDLNGVWNFGVATSLERPDELAEKTHFTEEEARVYLSQTGERVEKFAREIEGDDYVGLEIWVPLDQPLTGDLRTSVIVEPADGKIPELTETAQQRMKAGRETHLSPPAGPEDRNPFERCILGFNAGPPLGGADSGYNANVLIVQTPDTVAIMTEMVNDTRIVPLDNRPHLENNVRQWRGDSRGRWEGDTLVVETRNFTNKTSFHGSGMNMQLTERFKRISDTQIEYTFRVEDPESFSAPWTGVFPITKTDQPMYEFACHEANMSMELMLSGARKTESMTKTTE